MDEIFLTILANFICPLRVILVSKYIEKYHSHKFGDRKSGKNSSKKED